MLFLLHPEMEIVRCLMFLPILTFDVINSHSAVNSYIKNFIYLINITISNMNYDPRRFKITLRLRLHMKYVIEVCPSVTIAADPADPADLATQKTKMINEDHR